MNYRAPKHSYTIIFVSGFISAYYVAGVCPIGHFRLKLDQLNEMGMLVF